MGGAAFAYDNCFKVCQTSWRCLRLTLSTQRRTVVNRGDGTPTIMGFAKDLPRGTLGESPTDHVTYMCPPVMRILLP